MLALPTHSTPRTVLSEDRVRQNGVSNQQFDQARRAAIIAPALLASLPFFFVKHCCRGVLNSRDTVSCRKVSLFSLVICVSSQAFVSNSFVSAASETCQCAKHCTFDFGDFGVLHGVRQCVLDTSRVALRLGRCVLLTEGCDRRGILQHLLRYSRGVRNTGSGLLDCCAAD